MLCCCLAMQVERIQQDILFPPTPEELQQRRKAEQRVRHLTHRAVQLLFHTCMQEYLSPGSSRRSCDAQCIGTRRESTPGTGCGRLWQHQGLKLCQLTLGRHALLPATCRLVKLDGRLPARPKVQAPKQAANAC